MSSPTKIIKSQAQARASKLKNKKSQLENLLRSRERIDYEIKNLKKSIARDQKIVLKEEALLSQVTRDHESLLEAVQLDEEEDDLELLKQEILTIFYQTDQELEQILDLLLKYDED